MFGIPRRWLDEVTNKFSTLRRAQTDLTRYSYEREFLHCANLYSHWEQHTPTGIKLIPLVSLSRSPVYNEARLVSQLAGFIANWRPCMQPCFCAWLYCAHAENGYTHPNTYTYIHTHTHTVHTHHTYAHTDTHTIPRRHILPRTHMLAQVHIYMSVYVDICHTHVHTDTHQAQTTTTYWFQVLEEENLDLKSWRSFFAALWNGCL